MIVLKKLKFNTSVITTNEDNPKRNRGREANDSKLFSPKNQVKLSRAFKDLNDMLTKGYAIGASLQLIGNHWRLNKRQQEALSRSTASQQEVHRIQENLLELDSITGKTVLIDGFNLLILLESALSGAFIFECADGTFKDLSGVHGSYKRVNKTNLALQYVGEILEKLNPARIVWLLDEPVSNSGRLKVLMHELATKQGFNWEVILDRDPDNYIAERNDICISSDSWILERSKWVNLGVHLVENYIPNASIIRFKQLNDND